MSEPRCRKLSARALARQVSGFVVEIHLRDVMRLLPEWSREQAEQFLSARQADIAERMLRTGLQSIVELAQAEVIDGQ